MSFIRVKSDDTGHEFDVNPEHAAQRPDWTVIDPELVDAQRPPTYGKTATKTPEPKTESTSPAVVLAGGDDKDDRFSKGSAK